MTNDVFSESRHDTRKPTKIVGDQILYQCTICKKFKPASAFYADARVPCGIRDKCKYCYRIPAKKKGDL